jgi:hypothetical protein
MKHQAIKTTALMLGILLVAAGPAQAAPIGYADVISLATAFGQSGRPSVDLRLRAINQQQPVKTAAQSPSTTPDGKTAPAGAPAGEASQSGSGGSLTATEVAPQQTQTTVETIQVGEVDGTICDCGPVLRPGGFPLWPLLGLGALPLLFLPEDTPPNEELPPPTQPPPTSVPEPATLLLFGSGLLAAAGGARRRRRQLKTLDAREV